MTATNSPSDDATPDAGPAAGVRWDLSDLYTGSDDPRIDADLDLALASAREFAGRYRDRVAGLDATELAEAVDALESIQERAAGAGIYAQLLFASDTAEPRHGALVQHVQERSTEIRNLLVFFELEWVAIGPERAEELLEDARLARRRHHLSSLRRYREHLLSEAEERLLEEKSNTGSRAFGRLFDELMNSMRFKVEHAGAVEDLSEEEVLARLYAADREARRAAAAALTVGLRDHARPLAFIFNTLVQDKAVDDRLRSYPGAISARNLANEIDDDAVTALLDACEARYPLVARYYRLKGRLLGIEDLKDYDRYAPLARSDRSMGFDDARRVVLEAYADFAPEMASVASRFFEEHWIDAELRPGKTAGAFSASTLPSLHPYVLLNYTGNLRDVMTVAHELGHGVHQYLARERGLFEQSTPLTTAETASVFGEMLVFRRMLRDQHDPRLRLELLCGKIEDAFATVFRQVAMTRFEQGLHEARRQEGELPLERVNDIWMGANRPMFGDSVQLTDDYAWWWLYIPHFVHSPFYCYAYAFGELLVLALVRRYDRDGDAFVPRYLELLRAGGSDTPERLLAAIDLDVREPRFWDGGLELLEELVVEAEQLADA